MGRRNSPLLRVLLLFLSCAFLPGALSLTVHLPVLFAPYDTLTAEMVWLICGFVLFPVLFFAFGPPVRTYILEHEISHILFALMSGVRIRRVSLRARSSYVQTERVNLLIALAPYALPLYTVVLALVYRIFLSPLDIGPLSMTMYFLCGLTLSFHIVATAHYLQIEQPDLKRYGYFFSLVVVFSLSQVVCVLVIALLFERAAALAYFRSVLHGALGVYERIGAGLYGLFPGGRTGR